MGGALDAGPQFPSPDNTSNAFARGLPLPTEPVELLFIAPKMLNLFTKFEVMRPLIQALHGAVSGFDGLATGSLPEIKRRLISIVRSR
jgi:hypothetical protein